MAPTRQDWVTSTVAAELTGLSAQWLTQMARAGSVRARRVPGGRWWLFDMEALPQHRDRPWARLSDAHITPHAIARFGERVGPGPAVEVIRATLAAPHSRKERQRRDGTPVLTLRAKGLCVRGRTYELRCVVVPGERPGAPPVVATVLQGRVR